LTNGGGTMPQIGSPGGLNTSGRGCSRTGGGPRGLRIFKATLDPGVGHLADLPTLNQRDLGCEARAAA